MTQLLLRHRQVPTAPQRRVPPEAGTARDAGLRPEGWYALSLDDLWLRHWDGAAWVDRNGAPLTVLTPGPGASAANWSVRAAGPAVTLPAPPVVPTVQLPRADDPTAQGVEAPGPGGEPPTGGTASGTRLLAGIRGTIGLVTWVAAALFVGVGVAILGIVLTT
jgi:hypothetical protein